MEAFDLLRSSLSRTKRSKVKSALSTVKVQVVDVVDVVVIEKAKDGLLTTLCKLTSTPSLELRLLTSVKDIKRRGLATSATRRAPCLPIPGAYGQSAGRQPQQASMMVAIRMLFGRTGVAGYIFSPLPNIVTITCTRYTFDTSIDYICDIC
jgi:hypothetical protein